MPRRWAGLWDLYLGEQGSVVKGEMNEWRCTTRNDYHCSGEQSAEPRWSGMSRAADWKSQDLDRAVPKRRQHRSGESIIKGIILCTMPSQRN